MRFIRLFETRPVDFPKDAYDLPGQLKWFLEEALGADVEFLSPPRYFDRNSFHGVSPTYLSWQFLADYSVEYKGRLYWSKVSASNYPKPREQMVNRMAGPPLPDDRFSPPMRGHFDQDGTHNWNSEENHIDFSVQVNEIDPSKKNWRSSRLVGSNNDQLQGSQVFPDRLSDVTSVRGAARLIAYLIKSDNNDGGDGRDDEFGPAPVQPGKKVAVGA